MADTQLGLHSPGDQIFIFYGLGLIIFGLFLVNIFSAFRQRLPVKRVIFSLFSEVANANKLESILRYILLFLLAIVFMVLFLDIGVNGMQLSH